jgi:MOSC domain-containing protein YiiM
MGIPHMDWQSAFNIALGLIGAIGGWLLRIIWEAQIRLKDDLDALERRLPETYARRDDLKVVMEQIDHRFDRLERIVINGKP